MIHENYCSKNWFYKLLNHGVYHGFFTGLHICFPISARKTSCKSVNMHHKNTEKHNPSLTTNISLQQLSCCFNTIVFVHYYVLLNMLQEKAYYGLHRHFTPLWLRNTCFLPPDLKACKKNPHNASDIRQGHSKKMIWSQTQHRKMGLVTRNWHK